ncbi:MAG: ABC transporter permease [Chloroflexota bacterium]
MILRFLAMRVAAVVPVLFGISIFTFLLIHLIPGDLVTVLVGLDLGAGPHAAEQIRAALHLNDPLPIQYAKWLWGVLHGHLGASLILGFPVGAQILAHLPVSFELAFMAITFSLLFGVPMGVVAARTRNRGPDLAVKLFSLLGLSTPEFFLGTIMILLASLYLPWVHTFGYVPLTQSVLGNLQTMIFPAVTLGFALSAIVMRYTRSSMLEVLHEQYVVAARAKGLSRRAVLFRHALRNALIPITTVAGLNGAYLIGGTVVVEKVFALPGVGLLLLNAIYQRDYTMVQGAVLVLTTLVVAINIIVDLLYYLIDPRIRLRA